jgi:hypothetical protein
MAFASLEAIAVWWCKMMHDDISWPSHGRYRCLTCKRTYPVPWEHSQTPARRSARNLASQTSDKAKPVHAS